MAQQWLTHNILTWAIAAATMKHMNSEPLAAKLAQYSSSADVAGHVTWTGRRGNHGRPIIRQGSTEVSAAAVAFQQRTERAPVGMARSDCDMRHCVAPAHVLDDLERRTVRLQLRALFGWDVPWDVCRNGHSWDMDGRAEPNLTLYCRACNTDRARRPKKEATS